MKKYRNNFTEINLNTRYGCIREDTYCLSMTMKTNLIKFVLTVLLADRHFPNRPGNNTKKSHPRHLRNKDRLHGDDGTTIDNRRTQTHAHDARVRTTERKYRSRQLSENFCGSRRKDILSSSSENSIRRSARRTRTCVDERRRDTVAQYLADTS